MSGRAKARAVIVLIGSVFGLSIMALPATPAFAATVNAVADSYVDAASPTTNFGTRTYLRADGSPVRRAYLRFVVSGVGAAGSALLKFHAQSGSAGVEVRAVTTNGWGENTITFNNAPAVGAVLATTGGFAAGTWQTVDVSAFVKGDGTYSFAITTTDNTAVKFSSRETTNEPQLVVPAPASPSPFLVSKVGSSYRAVSQSTGLTYNGSLKFVVESAVHDLEVYGGGRVNFTAGTFDFGAEYFKFFDLHGVEFVGAGMNLTIIQNNSSAAADTEPFNFTGAFDVTVRDLTVAAGGPVRTTSDALDFDNGNNVLVERVKVTASRGRGVVFDGKNDAWQSLGNVVRDCVITGTDGDGIELLASSQNTITGCTITNVGGHGIQVNKSSTLADQPNKKANDNVITNNVIDQAGQDGINVVSGDRNRITNNTITNSSNVSTGRDGIRITTGDSIACDDNVVSGNTATDNQTPKTQKYGLNITAALCHRTVVGTGNNFSGNLIAPVHDLGTGTIYL